MHDMVKWAFMHDIGLVNGVEQRTGRCGRGNVMGRDVPRSNRLTGTRDDRHALELMQL